MVSPYVLIRATRKGIYLAANAEVDGYITLTFRRIFFECWDS